MSQLIAPATPIATLQTWLTDAQTKLHLLRTGRLSVEVEVEGRRVKYARTDEDALVAYIADLEALINNRTPRRGSVGFFF